MCAQIPTGVVGWHYVKSGRGGLFTPRTSHASAYDSQADTLFFYGGFDLNGNSDDLLAFKFGENEWTRLLPRDNDTNGSQLGAIAKEATQEKVF